MDHHPYGPRDAGPARRFLSAAALQADELRRRMMDRLLVSRRTQVWLVLVLASTAGFATVSVLRAHASRPAEFVSCADDSTPSANGDTRPSIPDGWRGVAMPRDVVAPQVGAGDTVDVVADGRVLAAGAVVVTAATDTVGPVVAVPAAVAPAVASAAQVGATGLVTTG